MFLTLNLTPTRNPNVIRVRPRPHLHEVRRVRVHDAFWLPCGSARVHDTAWLILGDRDRRLKNSKICVSSCITSCVSSPAGTMASATASTSRDQLAVCCKLHRASSALGSHDLHRSHSPHRGCSTKGVVGRRRGALHDHHQSH